MTGPAPHEVILGLATANIASRVLHVVADLGLADHLDDDPRTADELAAATGTHADAIGRMLRLLEERGVFTRDDNGRWRHTPASRYLRSDHRQSVRAFARMTGTPVSWGALTHLEHTARTGQPGITQLEPDGWLAYLDAHPEERAIFQDAMTAKAHDDIDAVLAVHDFGPYARICDVGGGHGHLLHAVLDRHPHTTGVLFELPATAADVAPTPRCDVVAGDFFTDTLPAADAYVLMNILHDWDDKSAVDILRAVAAAGRESSASVLVLETILPETSQPHWARTLDVLMLAVTGGRERTLAEYRDLYTCAAIDLVALTPTTTPFSILEGRIR